MSAIIQRPRGAELLVAVDFNTDLVAPEGHDQDKTISADMVT